RIFKPKCPICNVKTNSIVNNFILRDVIEEQPTEERLSYSANDLQTDDYTMTFSERLREQALRDKRKREIEDLKKYKVEIELEIAHWTEQHDEKYKEIKEFRANKPMEVLDRSSFFFLSITSLLILSLLWLAGIIPMR
ncbi:hypothetical protein PENTCL1PPCAC_8740, partial [Pristionchus entomophagus]